MANSASTPLAPPGTARRALLSSLAGTTVEWYEFFIYGTAAALVFGNLFFPEFDPLVSTLLSLSTFAVAFVARPVGGAIFGHFGDRIGRKSTLVITLTMMGGGTFLIGVLPTYEQVGIWAPIALVLLRLLQGLSLGGEYSGAVLMSVEHAGRGRRGLFGAIVNTGSSWGLLVANVVFLVTSGLMPEAAFSAWGWRIPFLLSAVLVALGLFIRLKVQESPEFDALRSAGEVRRTPLSTVLRGHLRPVLLMALAYVSAGATFYLAAVFSLGYGEQLGVSRNTMLTLVLLGTALTVVGMPFFGWLSDRVDRKRIFLVGTAVMMVSPFAWFLMLNTGVPLIMLGGFIVFFLPFCANYGTMPTFFAQVFPASIRYSGMAIGYTLGTVLGSATAPLIATYLLGVTGTWLSIAAYMVAAGLVSFVAALFLVVDRSSVEQYAGTALVADSP